MQFVGDRLIISVIGIDDIAYQVGAIDRNKRFYPFCLLVNNWFIEMIGERLVYKVVETECFCGGYEVINTETQESCSEIYTYAAEAQERADELNKEQCDE